MPQVAARCTLAPGSIAQSMPQQSGPTVGLRLAATVVVHLIASSMLSTWQPSSSVQAAPINLIVDFPMYISNFGLASQQTSDSEQRKQSQSANPMASSFDNNDLDDSDDLDSTYSPLNSARPDRSTETDSLALDLGEQIIVINDGPPKSQPEANSSDTDNLASTTIKTTATTVATKSSTTTLTTSLIMSGGSNRISNFVRRPNGQLVQFCDETTNLKCDDENAICDLGACVCKPGFFSIRMLGVCQSVSDLMKNCENDYQCQAIYVDLICDTRSHERPFCDCADGLFFDQELHTCLPCQRVPLSSKNPAASNGTTNPNATASEPVEQHRLRPCKAHDLTKFNLGRRRPVGSQTELGTDSMRSGNSANTNGGAFTVAHTQVASNQATSDPLRLKTPFEVFMGAIMLFTLFTVAWFFLQRMIHDCRAILRSLRNPEFAGGGLNGACPDSFTGGPLSNLTVTHHRALGTHHYFDPTGQAVARLFPADTYNPALSSLYQRDLAGVMVQHLTANLSPSSTSHTLVSANGGTTTRSILGAANEHEAALYPLTASAQQTRHAAAAAAAQLLLSPTHPAIAILRAAAAAQSPGPDYATSANLLSAMFDPPPKYEEAVAQSNQLSYQTSSSPPPPPLQPSSPPPPPPPSSLSLTMMSPQEPAEDSSGPTIVSPADGSPSTSERIDNAPTTPTVDQITTGLNSPFVESSSPQPEDQPN